MAPIIWHACASIQKSVHLLLLTDLLGNSFKKNIKKIKKNFLGD